MPDNLKDIKNIEDIPHHYVSWFATIILCYLCVVPIIASITFSDSGLLLSDGSPTFLLSSIFPYGDHWYRLQWSVLILSFLFIAYSIAMVYKKLSVEWLKSHKAVLWFGVLFVLSFFSFLNSNNHSRSFWGTGYRHDGFLTYVFFLGLFCTAIQLNKKQIRIVLEVFTAVGTVLGLLCIFPILTTPFTIWGSGSTQSIFCQKTHYGFFLSMCIPAGMALFLTDKPSLIRFVLRILQLWVLFNSFVFNATRATAVGIAVISILLFFFLGAKQRVIICVSLLLATVLFLHTSDALAAKTTRTLGFAEEVKEIILSDDRSEFAQAADRLTSYRYTMWTKAVGYGLEKPILGWGPDNLGDLYYADGIEFTDRPHNEFIQIGASLGIPALVCYCLGLNYWAKPYLKKKKSKFENCLFLIAVSYIICSFFSNSMYYTTPYFYMILGFSYKEEEK